MYYHHPGRLLEAACNGLRTRVTHFGLATPTSIHRHHHCLCHHNPINNICVVIIIVVDYSRNCSVTLFISHQRDISVFCSFFPVHNYISRYQVLTIHAPRYPSTSRLDLGFLHFVVFAEIAGVGGVACHGGRSRNNCSPFYFQSSAGKGQSQLSTFSILNCFDRIDMLTCRCFLYHVNSHN